MSDNPAPSLAQSAGLGVVALYVLDSRCDEFSAECPARQSFLLDGLRALDSDLRQSGSRLVYRRGDPVRCVPDVAREVGAGMVVAQEEASPYGRERDAAVADQVPLRLVPGLAAHPLGAVRKVDGEAFSVFTPYRRAWQSLPPFRVSDLLPAPTRWADVAAVKSETPPEPPSVATSPPWPAGEREARRRLDAFVSGEEQAGLLRYAERRDRADLDGTSGLSPYFRFGMLSAREAVLRARLVEDEPLPEPCRASIAAWVDELVWRDFYLDVLAAWPDVLGRSFRARLRNVPWREDEAGLAAWSAGRTGYPLVDAGLRQLARSGWMHNRVRMVAASFLTKDLLVDWRRGERHFMEHLVDGDPASNNGGWQWAAGTGTDAAPYFRVFNPTVQARRHDPTGDYIRRWLPELACVPLERLHAPWEMTDAEQRDSGCVIERDYPRPIVEHALARERAIAAYRSAR